MLDTTTSTLTFDQQLTAALPMLRCYAISLCRSAILAEDLVQEASLKALTYRNSFQVGSNFEAWVTTILRNHYMSVLRKGKREVEDVDGKVAGGIADSIVAADNSVVDEYSEVAAVLDTLSPTRKAIMLARAEGESYLSIAARFQIEEGTVKSSINRARETLGVTQVGVSARKSKRKVHLIGGNSRFRKIDTLPFDRPPKFETELGVTPKLLWLPLTRMFIDESYQRNVLERGMSNVYNIAREFDWKKFSAVVVAKVDDKYAIVDGQHRTYAAALRGIVEIPCLVIEATTEEQAAAFAAINAKTTRVDDLQVFNAAVAAKDPAALEIVATLARADVTMHRYRCPENRSKPRQTMALGSVRVALKLYGGDILVLALKCILMRHRSDVGVLRGPTIRATVEVIAKLKKDYSEAALLSLAEQINFQALNVESRILAAQRNIGQRYALAELLMAKFTSAREEAA